MAAATGVRASLLEAPEDYSDQSGCPGCLLEQRKLASEGKGAPLKELSFVAVMVLCNALPISSLFPFIYFMVRDFGIAKSTANIGSYAGYIGSALMFGRFLTATFWGFFADRYGRKPVMIIGTASIVVFNTMFGFSTNFWTAMTSRFLIGLFNGLLGSVRAYASEVCNKEYQATGLSVVGTMWGVGLVIGPAIGGYLAQPSDKYPSLFPSGSLFDRFPYALPCLCISAFTFLGLIMSFWLPESVHSRKCLSRPSYRKPGGISVTKSNNVDIKDSKDYTVAISKEVAQPVKKSLWKNWAMISSIIIYCIWSLHQMAYSEVFSLWAVSPQSYGGLGFSTSEVGDVLAASGAALLVFQLFVFAALANRFGAIQLVRIPSFLTIPVVAIHPLISRLDGVSLWTVLILSSIIKNVLSICINTGTFILINNSVTIKDRGFANGVSMSFMSLFQAIGPAIAGVLFSWAQERIDAAFLPGMWSIFVIMNIVVVIMIVCTYEPILPSSLLKPVPEERDLGFDKNDEKS